MNQRAETGPSAVMAAGRLSLAASRKIPPAAADANGKLEEVSFPCRFRRASFVVRVSGRLAPAATRTKETDHEHCCVGRHDVAGWLHLRTQCPRRRAHGR